MEPEGHPTQDLVDELQRRGGLIFGGTDAGPDPDNLEFARHRQEHKRGVWLFLPAEAYETGFDDLPPVT
jgi:hypothetical protein